MSKQIRIRIHLDENLKEIKPLFFETYKKKSLVGSFFVNFLTYLKKNFGKEFTEKFIKEVAYGNYEILKELLSSSNTTDFDSVHQDINLDNLLLE